MSRKYLASLAFAAVLILTVGIFLRQRLMHAEPPTPAPPSEASALQQLSQEGQLRRQSEFLSERVSAVAPLVVYVPEAQATGVRWGQGNTLVTTLPDRPLLIVRAPPGDSAHRPSLATADSARREWVLVVGRTPSGAVVSTAGILGGRTTARCGDLQLAEYVVSAALHDGFAGAGLFDLAGRMIGLIVRCGGRTVATPVREVTRVLADTGASATRVWDLYGLAAAPLDDRAREYFGSDSGVLVTSIRRGTPADAADLRPGDLLLAIDGRSVTSPGELAVLGAETPTSYTVSRRRGGAVRAVRLARGDTTSDARGDSLGMTDAGIEVPDPSAPTGVVIGAVRAGSPAAAAGLRPGDRLLRIGDRDVRSAGVVRSLLVRPRQGLTFIVFERDSVVRGVLLPR